ncbi:phosphotransferase [Sphingomonas sp. MMS24-JH45]
MARAFSIAAPPLARHRVRAGARRHARDPDRSAAASPRASRTRRSTCSRRNCAAATNRVPSSNSRCAGCGSIVRRWFAPRLVHGDFRTGNFLRRRRRAGRRPRLEACHLGDPIADLGWLFLHARVALRPARLAGGFGRART